MAANFKIQASQFLAQRAQRLTDVLNEIVNTAIHDLQTDVFSGNKLLDYSAHFINVPPNEYYDMSSIREGKITKFLDKSNFYEYTPLKICKGTKCAVLVSPKIYVEENTDFKCEVMPSKQNKVLFCKTLVLETCYFAKSNSELCPFEGQITSVALNYTIKNQVIVFYDRRRRKKTFYLTDGEIDALLDSLFPFSDKLKSFLDSLAYKSYHFSIHILLLLFLGVKLLIKAIKFIRKRQEIYRQAKLNIEREQRAIELQELSKLLQAHNPNENEQRMLSYNISK